MDELDEKTIKLDAPFHAALKAIKQDTGAALRFSVHIAIRMYVERYFPEYLYIVKGEDAPPKP